MSHEMVVFVSRNQNVRSMTTGNRLRYTDILQKISSAGENALSSWMACARGAHQRSYFDQCAIRIVTQIRHHLSELREAGHVRVRTVLIRSYTSTVGNPAKSTTGLIDLALDLAGTYYLALPALFSRSSCAGGTRESMEFFAVNRPTPPRNFSSTNFYEIQQVVFLSSETFAHECVAAAIYRLNWREAPPPTLINRSNCAFEKRVCYAGMLLSAGIAGAVQEIP